jgi:hypothetical protein
MNTDTTNVQRGGAVQKTTGIVIVVMLVVVIGALAWWEIASQRHGALPVFAPAGQLIAGFPKELVLDPAAQISKSYAINYSSSTNQYTANWISSSSIDDLYREYLSYFASHGWAVINSSTNTTAFRGIYAVTATEDTNIVINSSGKDGLAVTLSYVKK